MRCSKLSVLPFFVFLLSSAFAVSCGDDEASVAPPNGGDGGPNADGAGSVDGGGNAGDGSSGGDGGGNVDAGGAFGFFATYLAGFGGARIAAVPSGGWVAAFGHSQPITVGSETIAVSGRYDIVVVRYDAAGMATWARPFTGGDDDDVQGLAVDDQGNVYVAGQSRSSTLDFGNSKTLATPANSAIGFIVKLDTAGVPQWAQRVRSGGGVRSSTVAARGTKVVYAGTYTSFGDIMYYTTSTGETAGPSFMNNTTSRSFVMDLDPATGNATWLSLFGAGEEVDIETASLDGAGNTVVAGNYRLGAMKDKTTNEIAPAPAGISGAGWVGKLTPAGDTSWVRTFPPFAYAAVNATGAIVAGGAFAATADLGKGPRTSTGGADGWIAGLDPANGTTLWDKTFGGAMDDRVTAVAIDAAGSTSATLATKGGSGNVDGLAVPTTPGAYLVRLEASGAAKWFRPFAAPSPALVGPESVAMSVEGVAAIGTFQGTVDFGKGGVTSLSTSGRSDTFVIGFGP